MNGDFWAWSDPQDEIEGIYTEWHFVGSMDSSEAIRALQQVDENLEHNRASLAHRAELVKLLWTERWNTQHNCVQETTWDSVLIEEMLDHLPRSLIQRIESHLKMAVDREWYDPANAPSKSLRGVYAQIREYLGSDDELVPGVPIWTVQRYVDEALADPQCQDSIRRHPDDEYVWMVWNVVAAEARQVEGILEFCGVEPSYLEEVDYDRVDQLNGALTEKLQRMVRVPSGLCVEVGFWPEGCWGILLCRAWEE